jgi:hypothetical protein
MSEELYEVEARDLLQKGLAWSDDTHFIITFIFTTTFPG